MGQDIREERWVLEDCFAVTAERTKGQIASEFFSTLAGRDRAAPDRFAALSADARSEVEAFPKSLQALAGISPRAGRAPVVWTFKLAGAV